MADNHRARVDPRVPTRVCCRREAARTGAALRAAEETSNAQLAELHAVKRRLRQYAATLDAVSVRAKEEIGVALAARNDARGAGAAAAADRDAHAARSDALQSALADARIELAATARAHEQADDACRAALADRDVLRGSLSAAQRALADADAHGAAAAAARDVAAADLAQERMARRAAITDRDALADALGAAQAQLAAAQRELALVRHQLATQAPPEISASVRRDIAERAAAAVERRTIDLIRTVAEHYLSFGPGTADLPPALARVVGVDTDDEVSEHEGDSTLVEEIRAMPPIPSVSPAALEDVVLRTARAVGIDPDSLPEDLSDLPNADALLQLHLSFVKNITADTEVATETDAVVEEDTTLDVDQPVASSAEEAEESERAILEGKQADLHDVAEEEAETAEDPAAIETADVAERELVTETQSADRAMEIKPQSPAGASSMFSHGDEEVSIEAVTDEPAEDNMEAPTESDAAETTYLEEAVETAASDDSTSIAEYAEPTEEDVAQREIAIGVEIGDRSVEDESGVVENDEEIDHQSIVIEEGLYEGDSQTGTVILEEQRAFEDVSGGTPQTVEEEIVMTAEHKAVEPETAARVTRMSDTITSIKIDPVTEESVCAAALLNLGSSAISPRGEVGPVKEVDEEDEEIVSLSSPPAHEAIVHDVLESSWVDVAHLVDDEDIVAELGPVPVVPMDAAKGPPKVVTMDDEAESHTPSHSIRSAAAASPFFPNSEDTLIEEALNEPVESPMSVQDFSESVSDPILLSRLRKSNSEGPADDEPPVTADDEPPATADDDLSSSSEEDMYRADDVDDIIDLAGGHDDDLPEFEPLHANMRAMPAETEFRSPEPVDGESMQFSDDDDVDETIDLTKEDNILPTNVDVHSSDEDLLDDLDLTDSDEEGDAPQFPFTAMPRFPFASGFSAPPLFRNFPGAFRGRPPPFMNQTFDGDDSSDESIHSSDLDTSDEESIDEVAGVATQDAKTESMETLRAQHNTRLDTTEETSSAQTDNVQR